MKSNTIKGYFFALIATIAFSNVYLFSKAALNEVHLTQFGVYWFAIGTILNLGYGLLNGKLKPLLHISSAQLKVLLLLGFLEILTTTTFFIAINIIDDPSITSFLGNMYPVMVTIGGVVVLKEKFGKIESIGIVLALIGTFVISYTGSLSGGIFVKGTGIVMINAFIAAATTLVVRFNVKKINPEILNLNRTFWLLIYSIIMLFVFHQTWEIPVSALKNIGIGAVIGPFLAILMLYYSLKHIEASRSSIIQSLKGIFVLIGSYLVLKTLPLPHQIIGGLLSVVGVLIMTLAQSKIFKKTIKNK